ncbi:FAD-dependent oxidoreductase [Aspergillus mulundensis]|uniref:FAD-binding domain-containing protein n=1 Tax=Aspergillus mulundensis TaxID=1810919 RepID=A0A3D8REY4_9EURO|nr:hypothetical protein DSM5745_07777 [Aspergillus mulundensis]RDW72605.1 hypothetical protein DSM5745_07777 [Aspergillus mulundensis]
MATKLVPKIAISGGGPAGLTLGLLLHKSNIPFTIYELRQKPTKADLAKPSGMLDLHEESGLAALRECGLYNTFLTLTGECSEAQRVANIHGNIVYADEGELSERPEISRHALTNLLTEHLPPGSIKYGHKLLSVKPDTKELDFGPHGKSPFDLLIGADGAWSRARTALTDVMPHYTGTQSITVTIPAISSKYPHLSSLIGRGSFSALGLRHGVMAQRGPADSARIYTFLSITDEHFPSSSGLDKLDLKSAEERILTDANLLGSFGEPLKELFSASCAEESQGNPGLTTLPIKPLYTLPTNTTFPHNSHQDTAITLIGDAAHLMPPWAGEGVNLAMWDALLLSKAIVSAFEQSTGEPASFLSALDPLLQAFETEMFSRVHEKTEETEANGKMLFGEDGAMAFKRFFERAYGESRP